jgi:hypothetical protein
VPKFNCLYCAAPCEGPGGGLYACRRCGKTQNVPDPPPFFFPFKENELTWIASVVQQAQRIVQEPNEIELDMATERTLKDICTGLGQRLAAMTGGADPRLQDVVQDAGSIGTHGYAVGRVVLGTAGARRDLKAVINYASVADFSGRLRQAIGKLRNQGTLAALDGVSAFCLHEAYTRWVYFEIDTRGLRDWSVVITGEIDRMLKDSYLLALIEESYYKDAMKALKSQGLAVSEMTPFPGPMRKQPPPAPSLTPQPGPAPGMDEIRIAEPDEVDLGTTPLPPPPSPATPKPHSAGGSTTQRARVSSGITSGMPAYLGGTAPTPAPPTPPPQKIGLTPMPGPPDTGKLLTASATGPDRYVECEFWVVDSKGQAFFAGYKFFDAAGQEIPKERFLKYGEVRERDGKSWFENRLNATQFLRTYGKLVATVRHIKDPTSGETEVYSNTEPGARPLREFFEHLQEMMKESE